MADEEVRNDQVATFEVAMGNAQRLLRNAETETNLALMERLEKLADSWITVAGLIHARAQG